MNKKKIIFAVAIVFLIAGAYFAGMGQKITDTKVTESVTVSPTVMPVTVSPTVMPETKPTVEQSIFVHVCGAVSSPGVYEVPKEARVKDAIEKAGGYTKDAADEYLNLARFVKDGEQLYVPLEEEAKGRESDATFDEDTAEFVNINTADKKELLTLPGIGEAKADAIIAYREQNGSYKTPEDVMKVSGIKEAAFQLIRGHITVN